jgi:pimeloyl-ACP methyl ester carboxylesterase
MALAGEPQASPHRAAATGPPRRRWRRRLAIAGAIVLLAWGAKPVIGHVVRQLIYPAPPVPVPSPPPAPLVEVALAAADGTRLVAWWLPPPRPEAPAVLMLHGNGENLETMRRAELFADFGRLGAGVLAVDYPGYGRSAGEPGETANVAAAEAAWEWLRAHHAGPRAIAGWSLGAAVAVQLAGRRGAEVDALVLMSGWDRLAEVAVLHFPPWLVETALPERYDSLLAAASVRCPSLVVHGDADDIIPARLGRRLFAALPEPKRWVELAHAGHNDLLARPEVWQAVGAALAEAQRPGRALRDP